MLTEEKIEIFKRYKGDYDGYHIQNKDKNKMISGDEWFLLNNFMQDIYLIRKGVAAESFEIAVIKKLKESCDNVETYNFVFELEKYLNGNVIE